MWAKLLRLCELSDVRPVKCDLADALDPFALWGVDSNGMHVALVPVASKVPQWHRFNCRTAPGRVYAIKYLGASGAGGNPAVLNMRPWSTWRPLRPHGCLRRTLICGGSLKVVQ